MTDLLTKDEAARFLGISRDTLDEIIKSGRLPFYRLGKQILRIHRDDLVAYVESCRVAAPSPTYGRNKSPDRAPRICGYVEGMDVV